jgi:hypothetical protein
MFSKAGSGYNASNLSTQKVGDLEINQDLRFQERSWRYQRTGWTVMAVIVLLSLAGLLGRGPSSDARAGGEEEGLEVQFERFGRRNAPQTLRLHVATPPGPEGKIRISIDRGYLESVQIDSMAPEAESVEGGPDRHTFEFATSQGETTISFKLRPEGLGRLRGVAAVEGRPPVEFKQFVFP